MNNKLKCSIVLSAYNGHEYIIPQLDSIANQTYIADEVIIADDQSTDDTVGIVEKYIKDNKLSSWMIRRNEKNKGWKKNFIDLINTASGDVVFCADQDDIWHLDKIEKMMAAMQDNPKIDVLVCDYDPFYESGAKKITYHPQLMNSRVISNVPFSEQFNIVKRPGCAMCFRRNMIDTINMLWNENVPHDRAIWLSGILRDGLFSYSEKLINYRRHANNNSDVVKKNPESISKASENETILVDTILSNKDRLNLSDEKIKVIERYRQFLVARQDAMNNKNLLRAISLIRFIKSYAKLRSYFADIITCIM